MAFLSVCRRLRQGLFHDKAGVFLAVLCVRLLAARAALAPLALAAVLLAIPADEARAHDDTSATLHAETYPLHEAAEAGDLDSVTHFINLHNKDVHAKKNNQPYYGYTPLHIAAVNGNLAIVTTLLAAGADVNAKNLGKETPLYLAATNGHVSIVSALIAARADVNAKSRESINGINLTPLLRAVANGHVSIVSALIAAGADVNNMPLHSAVRGAVQRHYRYGSQQYASVVSVLIAAGADVNVTTSYGETPLHKAVPWPFIQIVSVLIAAGADVTVQDNGGYAPLHRAASNGRISIVMALIAAGADVNVKRKSGATPLRGLWSQRKNNYAGGYLLSPPTPQIVASVLIAAGGHWGTACANAAVVNPAGPSPPCICEPPSVGTPGNCVAPSVENCGGLTPPQLYSATLSTCVAVAECASPSVLNAETNRCDCPAPNFGTDGADTPGDCHAENALHQAVQAGDLDLVNHLITVHMADVNVKDRHGEALLYIAADRGHASVVSVLIAAGADVNAKNNTGKTPLHEAAADSHISVVSVLIAAGADVNAKDNFDQTPLRYAGFFISVLIAAGGHWGTACANAAVVNPAGAFPPCICQSPNVGTPGDCAAPSEESCRGLIPAKFYDSAAGECVAPSAPVCGGLTPAKFYSATLSVCAPFVECAAPSVLNAGANLCDCPAPNAGTDGADAPGDCAAASAESCGGLTPAKFYDSAAGECVAFAECASPAVLNAGANLCDCPTPNIGTDGADAPGDCHAENALHQAAYIGDVDSVNHLISIHMADVNAKDDDGKTPLHWAADYYAGSNDRAPAVVALIAAGADINAKTIGGETPLRMAAAQGYFSIVSALIAAGADVNAKGFRGWTPLHGAVLIVSAARLSIVLALIAARANVNVKDDDGKTPLHYAVRGGSSGGPRSTLIAAGGHWGEACVNPAVVNPATPSPPCVAPSAQVCGGFIPAKFYDAAAGACVPFAECADSKAEPNRVTNECECTRNSAYRYLRASGACESSCNTAESAVWQGRANAGISQFNYYKCECPTATATDVNGVCEYLYPCHDSAIVKADNSGCECPAGTFAHGDPSGGERYRTRHLVGRLGFNARYIYSNRDKYGRYIVIPATAECHSAPDGHHAPLAHNLKWTTAMTQDDPELILHFISDHGRDTDANSDLHYAVGRGYHLAAKTLIESGADIDRKNGAGDAPLHPAVRNERAELITLLLQRGADADAKGEGGDTALHLAARRTDTAENVGLIAFLLDKGANPNPRNDSGWRPLDLAYHGGDPTGATWQARRGMMAALIAGGATWSDECTSGAIPNENYRPSSGIADCVCPLHISERDSRGRCECPGHSHAQVNGRCLPKDSAQVEAEILKMEAELLRLRAALVSLNAKLTAAAEMPREMVEEIAEQAGDTAQEIKRRRDNFLALARADLAGAPPPPVAMSDTAAECRMLGGEVQIHSATGIRICSGIDKNGTFCLVDSSDAYPCRGLFRHVRTCNDDYNRPALNPFFCGPECGNQSARGAKCGVPAL